MMKNNQQTFSGSCHCKAIQFEINAITPIAAMQCNCSICIRKNAIMSKQKFTAEEFTLISGEDALAVYHWNDNDVNHFFCKHCGIFPFNSVTFEPVTYRVNLGCIDSIDPRSLEIEQFDGKNLL